MQSSSKFNVNIILLFPLTIELQNPVKVNILRSNSRVAMFFFLFCYAPSSQSKKLHNSVKNNILRSH